MSRKTCKHEYFGRPCPVCTRPQGESATVKESLTTEPAPAEEKGWWECTCRDSAVPPEAVTYDERHDERAGGCGRNVRWVTPATTEPAPADVEAAKEKEAAELVTDWQWIHNVGLPEIAEGALIWYITSLVSQAEQRAAEFEKWVRSVATLERNDEWSACDSGSGLLDCLIREARALSKLTPTSTPAAPNISSEHSGGSSEHKAESSELSEPAPAEVEGDSLSALRGILGPHLEGKEFCGNCREWWEPESGVLCDCREEEKRIAALVSQAEQRARQAGREEAIRECAEAMCPNSPCKKAILSKLTPPTDKEGTE